MEPQTGNGAKHSPAPTPARNSQVAFDEWLQKLIATGSLDFNTWTSLISKIEEKYPDDIKKISSVYDSFLKEFPLCHGYWKTYAIHQARLSTLDEASKTFKRAVLSATYCISVWVDYCSFAMAACIVPSEVRRLFKKALSVVGKDYLCHLLWDMYAEFETSQQEWIILAEIYVLRLKFPTEKLHHYYENFKEFVGVVEEDMKNLCVDMESEPIPEDSIVKAKDEVSFIIDRMLDTSTGSFRYKALKKYVSTGEQFYQRACELEREIHQFETNIGMPYFDVKQLDDNRLGNWHRYLDFIEMQKDFDWAVKLYERCLVSCANYPEFWMRYVDYMEKRGGRELANYALERATTIFLKDVPAIHLFKAQFKERIGDKTCSRAAFIRHDNESGSCFIDKVVKEANMEKRQGNLAAASSIYEKALQTAARMQTLHNVPTLYLHFSRLKYMTSGNIDAARDVIIDGIRHLPHCKLLLEGLINFLMVHGGEGQVEVVDPVIVVAITPESDSSQGLCPKDREEISMLYLEFLDQCGTIHDISKAWNRHVKLFPHLLRTAFSDRTSDNQSLDALIEFLGSDQPFSDDNSDHLPRSEMLEEGFLLADQPSEADDLHDLNHSEMQDEILLSSEDHAIKVEVQPEEEKSDRERLLLSSPASAEDELGMNKSIPDPVHPSGEASMEIRTNLAEHFSGEDGLGANPRVPENGELPDVAMESTPDPVHQNGENASGSLEPTCDLVQGLVHQVAQVGISAASQQTSDSTNLLQEHDHEPEKNHDPEKNHEPSSLNSLSLDPREKDANEIEVSAQNMDESENFSSLGSQRNPLGEQANEGSEVPEDSNRTCQDDTVDLRSTFHGDSRDQENQKQQVSSEQQPETEMCTETPMSRDDRRRVEQDVHMQDYEKIAAAQQSSTSDSSPLQNLHQQIFAPAHQSQHSHTPMGEVSVQSDGQFTHVPSREEYNQMVIYMQQQQQQQAILQQQQYAQQVQQLGQQPYYQQQQEHLLQPHQKQLLAQLYYQQLPQMQEQQGQMMQQQQQQQQEHLYYQYMQLQGQQGYQQWQLQYQMHQQQVYQQMLQQQHQQQLQMQEYPHNQHLIASAPIPMWNGSFYGQGPEVMAAHGADGSANAAESSYPQQHSLQHGAAVTPDHQLQPPHGVASPQSARAPTSPYKQSSNHHK